MEASESVQPEGGAEEVESAELDTNLYPGLDDVPAEYRQYVDPIIKEVSTNANKKVEDVNSKLKGWEPYQELGVNEVDPQLMSDLLQFAEIASDEDAFREWWEAVGGEYGFLGEAPENEDEDEDYDEDEDEEVSPEELQQALDSLIEQRMQPFYEAADEQEQERLLSEADQQIGQQLDALREKHGDFDEAAVCKLALAYDEDDAVERAFEDYMAIRTSAENGLLEDKSGQPPRPEGSGPANTTPQKITTFAEAKEAAKEKLAQEFQS
jgi:hypothetical protein